MHFATFTAFLAALRLRLRPHWLRLRTAGLRLRTAVTWWLLSRSIPLRAASVRRHRAPSHGMTVRRSLGSRLAPRPGQWHRPGTFTVFDWSRATVVDVQMRSHRIAIELQLEEGTITRVSGTGVWTRPAPRLNIVRMMELTDATYPLGDQLLMLPRRRASVRYVREHGHAHRLPSTPKVMERLDAGPGAVVPLRTEPVTPSHRQS